MLSDRPAQWLSGVMARDKQSNNKKNRASRVQSSVKGNWFTQERVATDVSRDWWRKIIHIVS